MLRKPPGVFFLGVIVCLCAFAAVASATIGVANGVYGLYIIVPLLAAMLLTAIRIVVAVVMTATTRVSRGQIYAAPALLVVTVLLVVFRLPESLEVGLIAVLLLGVVVLACWTIFTIGGAAATPGSVARVVVAPLLVVATFFGVLAFEAPAKLRLAASENALEDYARTVTATECSEESFRPRRVGLYRVTCAERAGENRVSLTVSDILTPDRSGLWTLTGPDPWEFSVQD